MIPIFLGIQSIIQIIMIFFLKEVVHKQTYIKTNRKQVACVQTVLTHLFQQIMLVKKKFQSLNTLAKIQTINHHTSTSIPCQLPKILMHGML